MNPASARRESRRLTLRPRVLDASSPSDSQAYAASAPPHQGPSVPRTPASQGPSVPRTPASQGPSVPGTPASQGPSVPRTPTSQGPSVPRTPSRQQSFIGTTPIRQQSFIRATPIRQQSFIRAIPSRQRPSVQAIPSSQRPLVHVIPSSQRPSVRATPSSQRPSVRATPSSQRPSVRAIPSSQRPTRSLQSVYRDRIADRLPKKYTQHEKVPPTRLVQGSKKIKIPEAVKTQAEDQDRRSKRFRDSFWHFCCSANGILKVLRMCITATSVFCFVIGGAQELFVVIMIQETCIVLFFIIIYLVTLQTTMACIHWPLLDLINSAISTVFLGIVGILVIGKKNTKDLCYAGGGCMISALDYFETMLPHPILVLLICMEAAICIFFIFLNTLAINRYILFVFWPMADIFNSLFSCVFLGGGIYFAFKARRLLPKPYLTAMILMGAAAICSFIDMLLQFQHFRGLRLRKW